MILDIVEEYFIDIGSAEQGDIREVIKEDPDKFPELIRIAVMILSKTDLLGRRGMTAWHYGGVINKCRAKNIDLRKIEVPTESMGAIVLRDLEKAVTKMPAALLWKIDGPVPVSVIYERQTEGMMSVLGKTSTDPGSRGSISLAIKGEIGSLRIVKTIRHELIHSLSFSKDRLGKNILPLSDWKEIGKRAGFYGYYDHLRGRMVRINDIRSVEEILGVPYWGWIQKEGDQLVNYVRSEDIKELGPAVQVLDGMEKIGVKFKPYDLLREK
jgi:hypothetical protein